MQIRKSLEEMPERGLTVTVYGDPGIGKTTLANTAPNPLILDFDNGYHRASHAKHYITYTSWAEAIRDRAEIMHALQNDYDTLVVDTVGTAIELMQNYIVETQPALSRNTIKLWGETKKLAHEFFGRLKYMGKNIVYIAHAKIKEEGDTRRATPLIPGSTYDSILQSSDLIGYYTTTNNKHILTFDLTDNVVAKNCAGIVPRVLPDVLEMRNTLGDIITETKQTLLSRAKSQEMLLEVVERWTLEASKAKDPNTLFESLANAGLSQEIKRSVWGAITNTLAKRGFSYDAETKLFTPVKQ